MSAREVLVKRSFDIVLSLLGLMVLGGAMVGLMVLAFLDTGQHGIFKQQRIGQFGKPFHIYKIRTLRQTPGGSTKATAFGRFLRRMKWDELPQLWNVLKGDMSFVGPRPDMEGYADRLEGEDRMVLSVKPGITGYATLHFKDEEALLSTQPNPKHYNDTVLWPKKVELNKAYIAQYSLYKDIVIILKTIGLSFRKR
ncbi:sugar transferase [Aestuariivivens sediminis]|uniref:sugar transferase n=1 Tax=Aestuariivivens sediminis TaxID=2913557 RepID=UPI001F5A1CF0|nr:sugar transferase [Aestuariivivens sediminis]